MKLPSCTARTRSLVGSNMSVIVIVESRVALVMDTGTVYGPPPTRNAVPGGDVMTCAMPTPGEVVGGSICVTGGAAEGGGAVGAGGASPPGRFAALGAGAAGTGVTSTVPGTGDEPGGAVTTVPPGPGNKPVPVPVGGGVGVGTPGAGAGGRGVASPGSGAAMSGGGPPRPRFCCDPMKMGLRYSSVISLVRTTCGVSSMTISVCSLDVLLPAKRCQRIG